MKERKGEGIGGKMIREGIEKLRGEGERGCVIIGEIGY